MADYRRMEWQYWANRIAAWARILCVLLMTTEVYYVVKLHFPLWDDIALPLTLTIHEIARFVDVHTRMYRIDL